MKNLKKIAFMTLLGVGTFIPAVKAYNPDQKNVKAGINLLNIFNSYVNKLDHIKNLSELKAWIKAFNKEMLKIIKNIPQTNDIKDFKNSMKKIEDSILSINKLNNAQLKYLIDGIKILFTNALSNF